MVKILSDSTCDLSQDLIKKYNGRMNMARLPRQQLLQLRI